MCPNPNDAPPAPPDARASIADQLDAGRMLMLEFDETFRALGSTGSPVKNDN